MAKCMMHVQSKETKRISNEKAKQMFKTGDWKYISKNDFQRILNQSNEKGD